MQASPRHLPQAQTLIALGLTFWIALSTLGCATTESTANTASGSEAANLYTELAAAYYQRGQYKAALERAEQAVTADARYPGAHYMLGLIDQSIGRADRAAQAFDRALQLDPDNPVYLNANSALRCSQGRYAEALAGFEAAAEAPLYETPELALSNAAGCALEAGQPARAQAYWESALNKNPDYAPALLGLAAAHFRQQDFQGARGYLARYSSKGEVTAQALMLAEQIESALGNQQAATRLGATRRERFPNNLKVSSP